MSVESDEPRYRVRRFTVGKCGETGIRVIYPVKKPVKSPYVARPQTRPEPRGAKFRKECKIGSQLQDPGICRPSLYTSNHNWGWVKTY